MYGVEGCRESRFGAFLRGAAVTSVLIAGVAGLLFVATRVAQAAPDVCALDREVSSTEGPAAVAVTCGVHEGVATFERGPGRTRVRLVFDGYRPVWSSMHAMPAEGIPALVLERGTLVRLIPEPQERVE